MTRMAEKRPSALMMSSVRPSLKNSRFGSVIGERQHRDRRRVLRRLAFHPGKQHERRHRDDRHERRPQCHAPRPRPAASLHADRAHVDGVDADRPGDVLHLLGSAIDDAIRRLVAHLVVGARRKRDAAVVGEAFEARGDVHAVPIERPVLDDHVAEVDADAKLHALVGVGHRGVARRDLLLDLDRALDRVDHRRKLCEDRIARRVDDAPAAGRRALGKDGAPLVQRAHRRLRVALHVAAVADDVGGEDRGQPPLRAHAASLATPSRG